MDYERVDHLHRNSIDLQWLQNSTDEDSDDNEFDKDHISLKQIFNKLSFKSELRRLLIQNPTSRIYATVFDLLAKALLCVLYIVRVCIDDHHQYACKGVQCHASHFSQWSGSLFTSTNINWHVLFWVRRPIPIWIMEVTFCCLTTMKAFFYFSISIKGSLWDHIFSKTFCLEVISSVPMIATMSHPTLLSDMFVPLFLNCWLAKLALQNLMNDLHLTKQRFQTMAVTLNQQICILSVTLFCLIFTTICGIQHIQRSSSDRPLTMFEAVYFVIITFSTVGYGDISPDIWLGQLFMFLMICVAFAFIPKQLEQIGSTWAQRKKTGGDYARSKSVKNKHVVVCASSFAADVVMNFLNEFYEHAKLEEHTVILMSSEELDTNMQIILKDPKWAHRILYIKGTPLKDLDLNRCKINEAESVFFLVDKSCSDQEKADHNTILRSWAVKDFAPNCCQYIQLFHAANRTHVRFAEHVVCEDEFKFALLANNCLYPGISTLVTLILHTSRGKEGRWAKESWQQVYGRHSGNEIYHIQLNRSRFFHKFEGQKFFRASAIAHQTLGVCLVAILDSTDIEPRIRLNPGSDYILKGTDYCFYMSLTKEECSQFSTSDITALDMPNTSQEKNIEQLVANIHRVLQQSDGLSDYEDDEFDEESVFSTITSTTRNTFSKKIRDGIDNLPLLKFAPHGRQLETQVSRPKSVSVERMHQKLSTDQVTQQSGLLRQDSIVTGPLPSTMNIASNRITCHLHQQPRSACCLLWGVDCVHCNLKNAGDDHWQGQLIVASVTECTPAVYNFIVPLRSRYLSLGSLSPIILLVSIVPDNLFLENIAYFPLVFWIHGSIKNLDDLLRAGIHKALHLVICNVGSRYYNSGSDSQWEDAETVVMVQKISRLFPNVNIITEMNDASNMRFMHFQADDRYTQEVSRLEKRLKEKTVSNLPYMFRLPFAAGQVFSGAMLDRLLYQTFVKGYLISFVRLLLGIDSQENSGHLSSVCVKQETLAQFPRYGDLYQGLCSTTGEIPIAIYRTQRRQRDEQDGGLDTFHSTEVFINTEETNLTSVVNSRLDRLGLSGQLPYEIKTPPRTVSYVIVNPTSRRQLKTGDVIYVVQPSAMTAVPNKLKWRSPRVCGIHSAPTSPSTVGATSFCETSGCTDQNGRDSRTKYIGSKVTWKMDFSDMLRKSNLQNRMM